MNFELELMLSEYIGLSIIALLSIIFTLVFAGCRVSIIERFKTHLYGKTRKDKAKIIVEDVKHQNPPYGRVTIVLLVFGMLMFLTLTHKLFFAVVVSDSMYPTFKRGDMYLAQAIDINPKPGDIIMFRRPDVAMPVSHRVLKIVDGRIYTGGDASGPDLIPITKKDVIAQAVMIGGHPIVIPGIGKYFILNAQQMRSIGPYGEEFLFYKNLIDAFKSYALAVIVICISTYIYLEFSRYKIKKL